MPARPESEQVCSHTPTPSRRPQIQPTSAIEDFSEVIKLDAKDANAFGLRGNARRMAGKLDQAVEDFTEGMRLDPEDMGIIAGRGAVWMFKREFDKAIQDFTLALEIEPNPVVLNNRGAAYLSLIRISEPTRQAEISYAVF